MIFVWLGEVDFDEGARLIEGNELEGTLYKSPCDDEIFWELKLFNDLSLKQIKDVQLITEDSK